MLDKTDSEYKRALAAASAAFAAGKHIDDVVEIVIPMGFSDEDAFEIATDARRARRRTGCLVGSVIGGFVGGLVGGVVGLLIGLSCAAQPHSPHDMGGGIAAAMAPYILTPIGAVVGLGIGAVVGREIGASWRSGKK
jgi:hypothetical protein